MNQLIERHPNNPILERDTIVGYDAVFSPGGIRWRDRIVLAVRAARDSRWLATRRNNANMYTGQVCDHILFESFDDGETFSYTGRKITGSSPSWLDGYTGELSVPTYFGTYGTEDLRLCKVDDTIIGVVHVMTHEPYRGDGLAGGRIGLVLTRDFQHYERFIVGPDRRETDRDAWIVDQGNRIAFFHRVKPDPAGIREIKKPTVQVAFFDDLNQLIHASPKYWYERLINIHEHVVLAPSPDLEWESVKVGGGPVIEHEAGYIMFYHGVSESRQYNTGAALLDKQTFKTIARLPQPLISPEAWYEIGERGGDTPGVTFPSAVIPCLDNSDGIQIYYGAADTHVARADVISLDKLVETILASPIKGVEGYQ